MKTKNKSIFSQSLMIQIKVIVLIKVMKIPNQKKNENFEEKNSYDKKVSNKI